MTNNTSVSLIAAIEAEMLGKAELPENKEYNEGHDDGLCIAIGIIRQHEASNAEKCKEIAEKDCQAAFDKHMKRAFNGNIQYLKEIMWETWKEAVASVIPAQEVISGKEQKMPEYSLSGTSEKLIAAIEKVSFHDAGRFGTIVPMHNVREIIRWHEAQQLPSVEATQEQLPKNEVSGTLNGWRQAFQEWFDNCPTIGADLGDCLEAWQKGMEFATAAALNLKPTPDNPCGHALRIHDVCPRCGMLGAAEYMDKQQRKVPNPVAAYLNLMLSLPINIRAVEIYRVREHK